MKGIDLCCQQHDVYWKQVKDSGQVDFIIPRTGWGVNCDGYNIDPKFVEYVNGAKANGITVPGVYHFIYVDSLDDAVKNAQCAINAVEAAGLPKSTIIWCDQEEDTVKKAVAHGFNLTTKLQRQVTEKFCDYILSKGYCTGVYLDHYYLTCVYGRDIMDKYDVWYADPYGQFSDPCLIKQNDWWARISGVPTNVDTNIWVGTYTAGSAKPKATTEEVKTVSKIDKFIDALQYYGDGRYKYYDGTAMSIGCSEYVRLSLIRAGIIKDGEYFHALSGIPGPLEDRTRFQKIAWSAGNLQRGDIMWCDKHHVAVWDGKNGVYEAAPITHGTGICDNGRTGVGRWSNHTSWDCGNGTNWWTCLYRIIDTQQVKEDIQKEIKMDKQFNLKTLIEFLPTIHKGSKGNTVKALQKIMKKYGWYDDTIDGNAGPNTDKGIRLMQTALGVSADGYVGPLTWTALLS